jgi:hypothetical protein
VAQASLEGNKTEASGLYHRLGAALGVEFAEDGVDVEFDGVVADVEAEGNSLVGQPFGQQAQYVEFAGLRSAA